MYGNMFWQFLAMAIGLGGLAWFNTKGIQIWTYGGNLKKMKNFDNISSRKEKSGPTLAQSVDARSKMMNRKKGISAMSAEEKNFRDYVMNGNRSCVTWNGDLLDGAFPPLNQNMKD